MTVEIPRYLADPEQGATLRNGASVRVRAIRPDDEPRLMALCRRLSPRTVYQRFFSVRRLLPEEAHAFANVDYRQRMAVVAEVDDGPEPELVGVARYSPSDEGTADIGLVVADAWQGLGLGDRKSTRLNSSHGYISYAVFCLKKKKKTDNSTFCLSAHFPICFEKKTAHRHSSVTLT